MRGRRSAALLDTGRTPGDAALQATPSPPGRDEFRHPVFASARPSFRRPHGAVRCFGRSDRSEQRSGACHSLMGSLKGPREQSPNGRHLRATAGPAEDIAAEPPEGHQSG